MSDEHTTHDSTDHESTTEHLDRRTLLQGAAGAAAGLTGASMFGGAAEAAPASKRLVVESNSSGKQTYEIEMASGQIHKGQRANSNDSIPNSNTRARGEIYNNNTDSYTYSGEIRQVTATGPVTFKFPDGGFVSTQEVDVDGRGPGRHAYEISTDSGDIDLVPSNTEGVDSDDGGWFSEWANTSDTVSGEVWGQKKDSYSMDSGTALNRITLTGGHARFRAQSQFNTGEAVLYFFYLGDSPQARLFQESTDINAALKGYDKKMLLKHDYQHDNITSREAVQNADTVVRPTRQNFENCLQRLRNDGYTIDLYIQSHGYKSGAFRMSAGSHGSEDTYTGSDIRGLQSAVGDPVPLRMVYQMNCWGSRLNSAWRDVGAKAVLGSRYVNFYPHEIMSFAEAWRHGHTFHDALGQSRFARSAVNAGLATGHAPATKDDWSPDDSGCPFLRTILGNNECAREYFLNAWDHDRSSWNNYPNRRNGIANIENASEKIIAGNQHLTNQSYY